MKDISIKSMILKNHFIIISFFVFIILSLCVLFGWLQYGINIKQLKLSHIRIEKLYIKWDRGLIVTADKFIITKQNNKTDIKHHYLRDLIIFLKYSNQLSDIIKQIDIKQLRFNDLHASIKYSLNKKSFLNIHSNSFILKSDIIAHQDKAIIKIKKFTIFSKQLCANGKIVLNHEKKTLQGMIAVNFHTNNIFNLKLKLQNKIFSYKISVQRTIKNYQKIIKKFDLPFYIKPWISDDIHVVAITLNNFSGSINLKHDTQIIKNINLSATFHQLAYTFNNDLAPIVSLKTELKLKNGILNIYPKHATYKNQKLKDSWLSINLINKYPYINVHLIANFLLNNNVKKLLQTYKINLPFIQLNSFIKTNLNLKVVFDTLNIYTDGSFMINNSDFSYHHNSYHINQGVILLKNKILNIKKLLLTYHNNLKVNIFGAINLFRHIANLQFNVKHLALDKNKLQLNTTLRSFNIIYTKNNYYSNVMIPASSWIYNQTNIININKITASFNPKTFTLLIPKTNLNIDNILKAYFNGTTNLDTFKSNFNLNILRLHYHHFKLNQVKLPLNIKFNKFFALHVKQKSIWLVNKKPVLLSPILININHSSININNIKISNTKNHIVFDGKYNYLSDIGNIHVRHITLKNSFLNNLIKNKSLFLHFKIQNHSLDLYSDIYGFKMLFSNKRDWMMHINLIKLSKQLKQLQNYHITTGYIDITAKNSTNISFIAKVKSSDNIFIKNKIFIHHYFFTGIYNNKNIIININHLIDIDINKDIHVNGHDLGINLVAIQSLLKGYKQKSNNLKPINIKLKDTYLYLKNKRKILSNYINILYINSVLTAKLRYKLATAQLRVDSKGKFYLFGSNFNDIFMNNLFINSEFFNGNLSFIVQGNLNKYEGIMEIKNTILKKYIILNNVLAFINTIPILSTFSLPNYSTHGLATKNIYLTFVKEKNLLHFKDITLKSKKIDIYGKGHVNLKNKTLNILLNLKTNIASNISKIPIVGYILFNKNSISTTLKVTGSLKNPIVKTSLAKDIVLAPFNIIKRTILSPFELLMPNKIFKKFTHF